MTYLFVPVGLLLPTLCGWLLLKTLEGAHPVLHRVERVAAGLLLGSILSMYVVFLAEWIGIASFSLMAMLTVQIVLAAALGIFAFLRRGALHETPPPRTKHHPWKPWQKILGVLLGLFFLAKLTAGIMLLVAPAYYDDVVSNWNLRGKTFYVQQEMVLEFEPGKPDGVHSYPPSVPLLKAWFAHVGGQWHEGLINSMHVVWYLAILFLLFSALHRRVSSQYALLGTYLLSSIPLFSMHGTSAYVDCFLSGMILFALACLYESTQVQGARRMSFVKISAATVALMLFLKNEALLLHLPPILVLLLGTIFLARFETKQKLQSLLWYAVSIAVVLLPWMFFKWSNNLAFGNAKGITGLEIEWHSGVLTTIWVNTFFEANWSLLPVLFFGLLAIRLRKAFFTPVVIFTGFFWMVWLGQLPIYLFTPLYIEAIMQTGYARGLIHLVPVVVMACTLLLHDVLDTEKKRQLR